MRKLATLHRILMTKTARPRFLAPAGVALGGAGLGVGGTLATQAAMGEPEVDDAASLWEWAKANPGKATAIGAGVPLAGYGAYKGIQALLGSDDEDEE